MGIIRRILRIIRAFPETPCCENNIMASSSSGSTTGASCSTSSSTSVFDSEIDDSEDERKTETSLLNRLKSPTQADTSRPRTMKRMSHPIGSVDVVSSDPKGVYPSQCV